MSPHKVIRHPVVLDALARYIKALPAETRVSAADDFRLSRGDFFGQIVDELLQRERQKHAPQWEETYGDSLEGEWATPFNHETQRKILRALTLLVATDSSTRAFDEPDMQEFRHGLFLNTKGVPEVNTPREALESLLCDVLGPIQVSATISDEERAKVQDAAIKHLGEAYSGHILANTDPKHPEDLVFALRHRFYSDYFVADALLEQIRNALVTGRSHELVDWCLTHHVGDVFSGSLDFLAWDPRAGSEGVDELRSVFETSGKVDEVLASYLLSLRLGVFLRRQVPGQERVIRLLQFAPTSGFEIALMEEFLPDELSHFRVLSSSFPAVTIDSTDLTDVALESCDFEALRLWGKRAMKVTRCELTDIECGLLTLEGSVVLTDTTLEIEGEIVIAPGAHIELYGCSLTAAIRDSLETARGNGADVKIVNARIISASEPSVTIHTPGRRFVNRLMSLLRRQGHSQFGVYMYKLRDKTPGDPQQFAQAVERLEQKGSIDFVERDILVMTPEGAAHMYQPRLLGTEGYDAHDEYWKHFIDELDSTVFRDSRPVV